MEPNQVEILTQLSTLATNISIVVVGVKLVRNLARMEMKVEMMWGVFMRRFGTRTEQEITPQE